MMHIFFGEIKDVALIGELKLSSRILPVSGVKEKVLAAHRVGVKPVVFPADNERVTL
ncbi:MAG: hypothetical protein JRF62_14610 [Deltaproteobacteria bacterium]|nr:hypothetical protein [Deltaproteobacteria bacterium]MBW2598075.1 hypothetical protein [Deltaproteobacteria bacterium]MBW2639392.1 hypothetical protein [Deltaproteobacteria bacterium]